MAVVVVVAITAMMLALVMLLSFAGAMQILAQLQLPPRTNTSNSSNSRLNAEAIYESNSVTADSDVEDLVIMIPDSSSDNGSKWQGFLPGSATVVSGTNVTWINADVNMTHGITLSSGEDGQTVFSNSSIPYLNGTTYMFQQEGEYMFADPATGINGTISVVEGGTDDPLTNWPMPTVGLIAVPASSEASLSEHLNRLGFNAVSSFREGTTAQGTPPASAAENAGGDNDSTILYIWIQEAADSDTVINRVASKLRTLEGIFCIPATR